MRNKQITLIHSIVKTFRLLELTQEKLIKLLRDQFHLWCVKFHKYIA